MRDKQFKISVAMCTYNGERYIAEQILSILNQTIPPDEIVIIDDCSSDNTVNIIEKIIKTQETTIKVEINKNNIGVTRNFEKAVKACKGDIIFLSDQDDVWFPNKIEKMIQPFIDDNKVGLIYSDAVITDGNLTPTNTSVFSTRGKSEIWKGELRDPEDVISSPNIKGCTMAIASKYIPLLLPIEIKADKKLWGHDHWIAFVLYCVSNVKVVKDPLMFYRIHEKNTSGNIQKRIRKRTDNSNKFKILYSTSSVYNKIEKYKIMLKYIEKIRNSELINNNTILNNYYLVLLREKAILQKRVNIWNEKSIFKKYNLIIKYFFTGGYFHYQKWIGPLIKDMIGFGLN